MRISELAERTGVSVASLKYYLREGLVHPGRHLSATRAAYDETHVERVRLVRTLIDVGRLTIERVREVVTTLDDPPASRHELMATAHHVLRGSASTDDADAVSSEARAQVAMLGLGDDGCGPAPHDSPAALALGRALTAARAGGWVIPDPLLAMWSRAMRRVAETDVVPELVDASPGEALRYAILGSVLTDPVLVALRRVEQERVSAQRLGSPPSPGG